MEDGPLLLDLFPLVGYVVAAGLVWCLYGFTVGIGGLLGFVFKWTSPLSAIVETPVNAGFKWLDAELGKLAQRLDKQVAVSFHRVARVIIDTAELFVGISALLLAIAYKYSTLKAAVDAVERLIHSQTHTVTTTKVAVDHLARTRKANEANAAAAGSAAAAAATSTLVRFVGHSAVGTATGVQTGARPIAAEIPYEIAALRDRTKAIEEGLSDVYEQIKAHGVTIAKAGSLAAVTAAVLRLGIGWTRCNNVGRVGKALCGVPTKTIDGLLGLFIDVLVITDICKVVELLDTAAAAILGPLGGLAGKVGAALCHGEYNAAPKMTPPELFLPPSQGGVARLYLP